MSFSVGELVWVDGSSAGKVVGVKPTMVAVEYTNLPNWASKTAWIETSRVTPREASALVRSHASTGHTGPKTPWTYGGRKSHKGRKNRKGRKSRRNRK